MEITRSQEAALKRRYRDLARGITGEEVMIRTGAPDCLGATSEKPVIWLGFHHQYLKDLDEPHTIACLDGTFAHEIMHRLLTKFSILKKISNSYSGMEQRIMFTINNIMEDNYIERMAPEFLGEFLIKALIYMRRHVYSLTPNIDTASSPYSEFEVAAIQYGDGGILKGMFKSKEAHDIFFECIPIFDEYMREPNPLKRYRLAEEVFELTRPLWESMSGDDMDSLMKDLEKCGREDADSASASSSTPIIIPKSRLKEMGIDPKDLKRSKTAKSKGSPSIIIIDDEPDNDSSESKGSSSDTPDDSSSDSKSSSSDSKSSKSDSKASKPSSESDDSDDSGSRGEMSLPTEEDLFGDSDDTSKSAGKSDDSSKDESNDSSDDDGSGFTMMDMPDFDEDGDDMFGGSDDSDESDDADSSAEKPSSDDGSEDEADGSADSDKDAEADKEGESDKDSSEKSEKADDADPDGDPSGDLSDKGDSEGPDYGEEEILEGEYELTDDDLDHIMEEFEEAMHAEDESLLADESAADMSLDYPVSDGYDECCKGKRCANVKVKLSADMLDSYRAEYDKIVSGMSAEITMLAKNLERIFKEDTGEKSYKTSGIVSIPRLAGARKTARVFTRRRNPKGLKDVHVCLLIDESGSTSGSIERTLRNACIGLAEVFAKLHMKTSVIGFTGDTSAPGLPGIYHAVHYHYLNGDNTPNNRLKLLTSRARVENFDGYSIRYAGEYLKRQKEEFKLLIVLSDGCPACHTYYSGKNGVLDTKLAVKEASKYCKVVGVLAGSSDPSKHQEMYGYNFLYIPTLSDLFNSLGAVIKKNIKDWS